MLCFEPSVLYLPLCVHPAWRQWRRKAQTPMMHLFSLFCRVRAASGFVCLSRSSRLVASEARSRSLPFSFAPALSFTLIPIGQCCPPLSTLSLPATRCLFTFPLNSQPGSPSLSHSSSLPCPRFQEMSNHSLSFRRLWLL